MIYGKSVLKDVDVVAYTVSTYLCEPVSVLYAFEMQLACGNVCTTAVSTYRQICLLRKGVE